MPGLDLPDIPIGSYEQYAADQFRALTQPVLDRLQMAPNPAIEAIRNQVAPENRMYVDQAVGAAQRAGIDPITYLRQIKQESNFNPNAGSNEGAKGISQFTDATAKGYGIDPYNPGQALDAGARYMATALATNHGDYRLALASYNAGQGNVDRYGQNIFNPAYLKAQGWSDEDANQPARYIASILGGGASAPPAPTATPASLVQGAGTTLGAAAAQVAQVPQQAVQSFKDYSAGLLHQFSQSLAPPPASNAGADATRSSDLPTPPDAPQAPDLGGSSFHDWSTNLIGQLAQTSSVPPAALSSPGAAVAGAAGGDVAASSPALSSPSPGYNDMVGASSTPQPPAMLTPATGGTPPSAPAPSFADWSTNLINQLGQRLGAGAVAPNAGPSITPSGGPSYNDMVGANSNGQGGGVRPLTDDGVPPGIQAPGTPGLPLLPGPHPLADAVGNVRDAALNQYNANVATLESATTPRPVGTRPSLADLQRGTATVAPLVLGTLGGDVPSTGGDVTRMYHGTGSAFTTPDGAKFDPNGLFGPGYYLTSDARVASSYAETRATMPTQGFARGAAQRAFSPEKLQELEEAVKYFQERSVDPLESSENRQLALAELASSKKDLAAEQVKQATGPNLRAVNVPNGLTLLNADAPIPATAIHQIAQAAGPQSPLAQMAARWEQSGAIDHVPGFSIYNQLVQDGSKETAAATLQRAGYDGIRYDGGQRVPLLDAAGQPIQHQAVVIFPESLPKITNAISGTPMGSPPAVGGAVLGGVYGATQGDTPQERAKNAALGALGGGLAGHVLGGGRLPVGLSVEDASAIGKAPPTVSDAPSFAVPGAEGTAAQQAALRPTEAGDAANIQLNKFGPATQPLIDQAAAENANFAGARRGVISDADALANAAQTAQATPVEKWLTIKPGTALNQEQHIALGQTLEKFGQDFDAQTAAIQKAKADGTATPLMLAEQAQKALQFGQLTAIRAGATSEAGRALRSFQTILTGANASAATQEEAITKAFKALGTSPEKFQDWMTAWSMTPSDNAAARVKLLQSLTQPTLMDKALTFGISNMLSSTKTGEIIGMHGAIMALNRPLLTVIRGDPLDAVANVVGQTRSIGSAWSNAVEALKTGVGPTTAAATLRGGTLEVRPDAFPGTAGLVVTPTLRAINAMHEFFRTTATAGALAEAARREALTSGRAVADLLANPTPKMLKFADDIAEQALHGGTPSAPAQLILNARNLVHTDLTGANLNAQNVGKVATGLTANLLLPFVKIPDYLYRNGAKIATGPLYYGATTATHALRGETSQAVSDLRMWGVVSLLWGGILGEAIAGNVTGSGPTDPTKLALLKEARDPTTGQPAWQAHSTRIPVPGGYRWVDNNVFGPLAVPLNALASAVEAYRLDGIKPAATPTDFMLSVANNTAKSMLDASYIRTAGQFFSAAMQGQAASAIAKTTGANIASRFIPFVSAGAEVARGMDPGVKAPSGPLQQIEARLPVLSRNVPNQVSPYGQPLQNRQDLVSTLSPAITSTAGQVNQAANEVARLNQAGQAVNVRVLPSTQQKGGGTYEGSPQSAEQIRTVQATLGQNAQRYIAAEINRPGYQALSDAEKAKTLNRALATADQQANQTADSSLNLDDKHKAALAWTQVPHFAGVSGTPAQVADRNLAIAKAKTTLSEYAKKYGSQQMGMYHLMRDDRAALNLALTPVLPASYLAYRKQAIDKKYGGALTKAAQEGLLDANQVLPVGSGG